MKKTTVFAYKGLIGILSSAEAEGMIARPGGEHGNLGCVTDASKAEISKEALELLMKIPKGRGGLGEIDVFKANDGIVVLGWLGGYFKPFKPENIEASRDYAPELLTATDNVEIPKEFMDAVDKALQDGE